MLVVDESFFGLSGRVFVCLLGLENMPGSFYGHFFTDGGERKNTSLIKNRRTEDIVCYHRRVYISI